MALKQLNLFSPSKSILKKRPNLGVFKKTLFFLQKPTNFTTGDRVCHITSCLTFVLIFTSIFVLALVWRHLSLEVPLFYSLPYGELQVKERLFLWLLPSGSLLIFFLNLKLAHKIFQEERLLAQILILTTSVVSILSTITLVKIIFLVI